MPDLGTIYLQLREADYFTRQHVANDELLMCGLLTLQQLRSKYPDARFVYADAPPMDKK